jgi:O-succinylhomoserine sulfhydrylase
MVLKFLRTAGPCISPFNAWVILKGLETLKIRMAAQSASALELATWLEAQPQVARVHYRGCHPIPNTSWRVVSSSGGAIVSFEVKGGRKRPGDWWMRPALSITANLGDTKTTLTHPFHHPGRISPEAREAAGIRESLLRVAVGLESVRRP